MIVVGGILAVVLAPKKKDAACEKLKRHSGHKARRVAGLLCAYALLGSPAQSKYPALVMRDSSSRIRERAQFVTIAHAIMSQLFENASFTFLPLLC